MKNYIDGLVGQQKLYSTALFFLFLTSIVNAVKGDSLSKDPVFSTVPIIGIKSFSDFDTQVLLLVFSVCISFWVSVSLLWWLYSFNKHHPGESLGVNYLPGMLFMPYSMRSIVGILMTGMVYFDFPGKYANPAHPKIVHFLISAIEITPMIIVAWVRMKLKEG